MTMDSKRFRTFKFEIGLLFEAERSKSEIEETFQKLLNVSEFDGVKKVSKSKKGIEAKLTSSDNTLKLLLSEKDAAVSYTNTELAIVPHSKFELVQKLIIKLSDVLPDVRIEATRSSHLIYSTFKADCTYLRDEFINGKYRDYLDDFEVSLDFAGKEIEGKELTISANVSNQHTYAMHKAFEKQNKKRLLKQLVTVYAAFGISDNPSKSQITAFFKHATSSQVSYAALERLGYGKPER